MAVSRLYSEMLFLFCNYAVHERLLRTPDDFAWPVDTSFAGRYIIDVEFLDLKICSVNVSSYIIDVFESMGNFLICWLFGDQSTGLTLLCYLLIDMRQNLLDYSLHCVLLVLHTIELRNKGH